MLTFSLNNTCDCVSFETKLLKRNKILQYLLLASLYKTIIWQDVL